jgi:hypothetical protein
MSRGGNDAERVASTQRRDRGAEEHNLDFLREVLHDELVFRRPDGTVADDEFIALKASPEATAGFPQIYILAPDRHVIEINAEKLDTERASQRHRSLASTRASRTTTG